MLKTTNQKWFFFITFAVACLFQIISASSHQLFGDEAFYWLESQHLDWSYAELPGWTQWMIALSQKFLPQHELTVRLPGLLAAFSLPWIGMAISRSIQPQPTWNTGLLLLALPLLMLAGILAIPDIWVMFFGALAVLLLVQCVQLSKWPWFFILGLVLAIGINVHVRFWLVIFIAALVTIWQYKADSQFIKKLLGITLPIMTLGFIPIIVFNWQHDFPLLTFQFSERHPWSFQIEHLQFFIIQFFTTTPLVFALFVQTAWQYKPLSKPQKLITITAVLHWLLYAILGFFSDELRFNWHWPLVSYVLLATVAGIKNNQTKFITLAQLTGILCSFFLMAWLYWALHISQPISQTNARFTENARGWNELAQATQKNIKNTGLSQVVTDHFMTLAALKFYLNTKTPITSLTHPLNHKHGRQLQLDIMGLNQPPTQSKRLLVVEHSSLKLEQAIPFYQAACETLNGIKLIDTLDYAEGIKTFYFFETGDKTCHIPPIIYIESAADLISGWIVSKTNSSIEILPDSKMKSIKLTETDIGNNPLFKGLDPNNYHLGKFSFDNQSSDEIKQLVIKLNGLLIKSQRL